MTDSTTATSISPAAGGKGAKFSKTTVPAWLMRQLKLKHGDQLTWELDKDEEGWFVKVRPKKIAHE